MSHGRRVAVMTLEVVLLVLAFVAAVPPPRSSPETHYHFLPVGAIALALFVCSKLLSRLRGANPWPIDIIHVLLFGVFVVAVEHIANMW